MKTFPPQVGTAGKQPVTMYVVYRSPMDFPGKFVGRKFVGETATGDSFVSESLEEVRKWIPRGMWNIGRDKTDEPQILEVWI
ncbi:MAG: hypothetical protein LBK99_05685 [Opitutaceae bacterium]|nr:hypothetical protein [Opitutaceae bacterium]